MCAGATTFSNECQVGYPHQSRKISWYESICNGRHGRWGPGPLLALAARRRGTTSSWNNASLKILRRLRTKLRFMRDAAGESRHSICNEWIYSGLCDQCLLSQTVDFSAIYLRRS